MTTHQDTDTELSPFLRQQAERIKVIAQQDIDIAERQKRNIVPGVQESERESKGKYEIVTHDATNDRIERRIITPLPTPKRIQPAKPITKDELTEMIKSLRSEMSEQQDRFDNKDAIDKERTDKRQELSAKVAELTQQLNAVQTELDDLNRAGSTATVSSISPSRQNNA